MLIAKRLQVGPTRQFHTRGTQLTPSGCVAVTHDGIPGDEAGACTPLSEIQGMSGYYGDVVVSEAKGYTCAQFKIAFPRKSFHMSIEFPRSPLIANTEAENFNCCDALRT